MVDCTIDLSMKCDLILENRPDLSHLVFQEMPILNIQATVVPLC